MIIHGSWIDYCKTHDMRTKHILVETEDKKTISCCEKCYKEKTAHELERE